MKTDADYYEKLIEDRNKKGPLNFNDKMVNVYLELSCDVAVMIDDARQTNTDDAELATRISAHSVKKFKQALKEYIER